MRHLEQELAHVPGSGGAALRAQAAVQADVLVLDHHPAGLERIGNVQRLVEVPRWRSSVSSSFQVKVMQSIGQMSTQASHSMQTSLVNTVCTSQLRQRSASLNAVAGSKPSSTSTFILLSVVSLSR